MPLFSLMDGGHVLSFSIMEVGHTPILCGGGSSCFQFLSVGGRSCPYCL